MKIEIAKDGTVTINTDEGSGSASVGGEIFPIHCDQLPDDPKKFSPADHTAAEITAALQESLFPVVFLRSEFGVIPCPITCVLYEGDGTVRYQFSGYSNRFGMQTVTIDPDDGSHDGGEPK